MLALRHTHDGQTLYAQMSGARQALNEASRRYQETLAIALDTKPNADAGLALKREGQAYAHAVMQYSDAVMGWLSYVDQQIMEVDAQSRTVGA